MSATTELCDESLFEDAPLPLMAEDFSAAAALLRPLAEAGRLDMDAFMADDWALARACAERIVVVSVNAAAREYFAVDGGAKVPGAAPGTSIVDNFLPSAWATLARELLALMRGERRFEAELAIMPRPGLIRRVILRLQVAPDAGPELSRVHVSVLDVEEMRRAQEELASALGKNQALLRELYHRTRNSLQIVVALLRLEADRATDAEARRGFLGIGDRVHAMALLHDRLISSGDLNRIDMEAYLAELADHLGSESGAPRSPGLAITVESDSISLPIDLANPCGMIVTELVGNAIRHAFPAGAGGVVRIWLKRRGGEIELGVADDGVGMPADEPARKGSGLGLETAGYIAEAQLGGKLELLPGAGTAWRIRFHAKEA